MENRARFTFETRLLEKDGSIIPAEATARLTRTGEDVVVLSALRDVSERKKAEETNRRAVEPLMNEV